MLHKLVSYVSLIVSITLLKCCVDMHNAIEKLELEVQAVHVLTLSERPANSDIIDKIEIYRIENRSALKHYFKHMGVTLP